MMFGRSVAMLLCVAISAGVSIAKANSPDTCMEQPTPHCLLDIAMQIASEPVVDGTLQLDPPFLLPRIAAAQIAIGDLDAALAAAQLAGSADRRPVLRDLILALGKQAVRMRRCGPRLCMQRHSVLLHRMPM